MGQYVITKVYVVEAPNAELALQLLNLALDERKDWLFQARPDKVQLKVKGWLTILREQLFGGRKDDPKSIVL